MKASIIIPTFNRLWCLPEALESCPNDPDVEIIVVDDGSTDGTWEWLSTQTGRPGIRTVRQSNWGKPRAVNLGMAMAQGRYIKFLDSDDLCVADAFAAQLEACLAHAPDICAASYVETFETAAPDIVHRWKNAGDFIAQQLGECDSSHYSAYLFSRSFLDGIRHRPEFAFCDDRMFILECALKQPEVLDFAGITLVHRHHARGRIQFRPGSVAVATNLQKRRMYEKILGQLAEQGELQDRRRRAPGRELYALAQRTAAYDWQEAREILALLSSLDPDYRPPDRGRNRLYHYLGFGLAQLIVNGLRAVRNGAGRLASGWFGLQVGDGRTRNREAQGG